MHMWPEGRVFAGSACWAIGCSTSREDPVRRSALHTMMG